MFSRECKFIAGVTKPNNLPPDSFPEIAFIGRSNVGKSSLINALLNRKSLARVSQNPGRTRQLNFFLLDNKLHIVDLPGYGYAKVSKTERADWGQLVGYYFQNRPSLRRVFILVDARRGLKDIDLEVMRYLDDIPVSYQILLTKVDKIKKTEIAGIVQSLQDVCKNHAACHSEVVTTSASKKDGINLVQAEIQDLLY